MRLNRAIFILSLVWCIIYKCDDTIVAHVAKNNFKTMHNLTFGYIINETCETITNQSVSVCKWRPAVLQRKKPS